MTDEGEPTHLDGLPPHQHMVISTDGSPVSQMPFDIADKTVAEIKSMGFEEVLNVDVMRNPRTRGLEPVMGAKETENLRKSFDELTRGRCGSDDDDDDDKDYLLDEMHDNPEAHFVQGATGQLNDYNLGQPESQPQEVLPKKLQMQKRIDDARIGLVHEALTKGVELEGNDLYYELLDHYPYYQKILSTRK